MSAFDGGFAFADGAFESLRVYGGAAFRAERHLQRLARALDVLGIASPPDLATMLREALHSAVSYGLEDATARITVTRGISMPGPKFGEKPDPTVVIWIGALPLLPPWLYTDGISASVAAGRRDEHSPTAGIKTLSYTDATLALRQAHAAGADEAILLDLAGHVSEGAVCNVFISKDGALATPPASCGALCGITREAVFECSAALGIKCEERPIWPRELVEADEAFTTQSLREVIPLIRVDGRTVGDGKPGPLTRRLIEAYEALVRRESLIQELPTVPSVAALPGAQTSLGDPGLHHGEERLLRRSASGASATSW